MAEYRKSGKRQTLAATDKVACTGDKKTRIQRAFS
jgi:hypothetical protein